MTDSKESISAESLSRLRPLLDQILPFASSPIDVLFHRPESRPSSIRDRRLLESEVPKGTFA
jgi:hypothetical protein